MFAFLSIPRDLYYILILDDFDTTKMIAINFLYHISIYRMQRKLPDNDKIL